jgi:hypothetical protein
MRRRGCLISFGALAALTLVCCLALWFVALPQFQDSIANEIRDGLSTEVARQVDETGDHTISMTELERELQGAAGVDNVDDMTFRATGGELVLSFGSQGQEFSYSGVPMARDGRMELTNVESTGGAFLDRVFPADKLADAVEGGVNGYFIARGLEITGVTAENNEMVFETREAGQ